MANVKIIRKTAPYLRRPNTNVTRMMRDVTIALIPATLVALYSFGLSALVILLLSIGTMTLTEYIYYQVIDLKNGESFTWRNKSFTLYNFSAITSGIIYGLTLPDNTAWWIVIIGGALGLYISKLIWGGMGQNIFNPAAVSRLIVVATYATLIGAVQHVDSVAGATALGVQNVNPFSVDALQSYRLLDLFTGIGIPGSIGEVSAIALIVGGVYLWVRTSFEVRIPLMFIGTVAALALAVGLFVNVNPLEYMLFHVLSGGLLFGAIYMATDPITTPITKPGRIAAGFMMGAITFIIRLFGAYPEGVIFSIVLMNLFVPVFDHYKWSKSQFSKRRILYFVGIFIVTISVVLVGVYYAR